MIKNIFKKLTNNNINCKIVKMCNGNDAIMCDTNYKGLYPTKETFELQNKIKKLIKRYNVNIESRGYDTALLITIKD
jgi:hypothetical protein